MMMMMIESAMAVRFPAGSNVFSSTAFPYCRSMWSSVDVHGTHVTSCRLPHSCGFNVPWNRTKRLKGMPLRRRNSLVKNRIQASVEKLDSAWDPKRQNVHRFQVNSKATLMFSSLINDEVHENIILPDLPCVTDEHGNIYFQVNNGDDVFQSLSSENNFVQVIIGLDTMEILSEMELEGPTEIDFGIEEIEDEDSDVEDDDNEEDAEEEDNDEDDDYDTDWVAVLEDEDDEDDSDETLADWAKLETMRSSHPMQFAKKLAEVASDAPIDWMDQPSASLAIQGLLRPAFIEEQSIIQKNLSDHQSSNADINQVEKNLGDKIEDLGMINGHRRESGSSEDSSVWADETEKDENSVNGTSFYRLEMIRIQLFSSYGHPAVVEVEDFVNAQPDSIAHSAAKIISRVKAGGEKTAQALKSLCWRCKGIQVEEAALFGVDSLGFDLKVCSGTQVQTLRFAFNSQATSEYSADRQLNDLLFPRIHQKPQQMKKSHQNEC
ncbi:uncharacterized protein At3g49140-like isoform X3 [Juglans microcarpa x Juglans regia]|uniref:uncharacterized protein At3g49140-like isoform X3 n=1 Tax=Juglans microcarpa x Juglans regia TaxID=2249226 RepID=UPI001B7DC062|nr:uncharacterized protein At3g49140-like isoform X3 [Juglans microcarpa x Juglans regia]